MRCLGLVLCFTVLASVPAALAGQPPTNAPEAPPEAKELVRLKDSGWNSQTTSHDCFTGLGDDSWELTLSKTKELRLTVTDQQCPGDYFEAFADGKLLGATPNLAPPWGCVSGGTHGPNSSGQLRVVLAPGVHRIRVRDAGFDHHSQSEISRESMCPAGFVVLGRLFDAAGLAITRPSSQQDFDLSESTLTATAPVIFEARGQDANVTWKADLEYETSGHRGSAPGKPYRVSRTFQTRIADPHSETYQGLGGSVKVTATSTAGGQSLSATPVTFTITGVAIPADQVTQRLVNLYQNGATPRLMTGVASKESTYHQFSLRTLYGRQDLWPTESGQDGGSHIGLMQLPTAESLSYAWSWLANTAGGVKLFGDKLASAGRLMKAIIAKHPGLRELTPTELENMALVLYGPYPSKTEQYYTPVKSGAGWAWAPNLQGNSKGVAYADACRKLIKNFEP